MIMGTTLPFQVYAAWAIAAFNVFAALASGLAFALGERAFDAQGLFPKWLLAAGASLLLLAALTIHQPAAMFFWVFAAVALLKPDMPLGDTLQRFGWYCVIALVGVLWDLPFIYWARTYTWTILVAVVWSRMSLPRYSGSFLLLFGMP